MLRSYNRLMRRSLLLDDPCIAQLPTQHKLTLGCSARPNPDEAWHTWSQCGYAASVHCPLKTPRSSPFPDPPSSKDHFPAAVQASPPLRSRGSAERPGCLHSLDPGSGLVIPPSRRLFGFFCGSIPALNSPSTFTQPSLSFPLPRLNTRRAPVASPTARSPRSCHGDTSGHDMTTCY